MRYNDDSGRSVHLAAWAPLTATLLAAALFAPAIVVRAQQPTNATAQQAEYQVTGTATLNGRSTRFRGAFKGTSIQAIHEVIDNPKGGDSDNDYTFDANERLVRFEGDSPAPSSGQSNARVKDMITWDANGRVTSSSRTVGGKRQALPADTIGAIRDHGDKLHGEAERVRREKGLPAAPAPAPQPGGGGQHPAQVTGRWSQNGMNGDFTGSFRGDGVVTIREVIHNPKGGDSINNYAFDQNDRLRHFDGNHPSQASGQNPQRIQETIDWNEGGKVTSSKRVVAGKSQAIPSDRLGSIRDHADKLHGQVEQLRRQQTAQKK